MPINQIQKYTAFDIETPNSKNSSICSIGIVHIQNNQIIYSKKFNVNPDDFFEENNMRIHGISSEIVKESPSFPIVWDIISKYFMNNVVLAHQASFDLTVLYKALSRYKIEIPDIKYICTMKKARRHIDKNTYGGYRLDSLCKGLDIPLVCHHNALDDATACALLYKKLVDQYDCFDEDIERYNPPEKLSVESATTYKKAMNTLRGILLGIGFDKKILPNENASLYSWMKDYARYSNNSDLGLCFNKIEEILEDGIITNDEYLSLLHMTDLDGCDSLFCKTTEATQLLMGIIEGIACDVKINDEEACALFDWMQNNTYLKGFYPYDKIFATLSKMLEDQSIDRYEERELLVLIESIIHPTENFANIQGQIKYNGNIFCLTGAFKHGSKEDISSIIIERGGQVVNSVSKKIQYLIVGGEGSAAWAFSAYGGKVQKALDLTEKGADIKILYESALLN